MEFESEISNPPSGTSSWRRVCLVLLFAAWPAAAHDGRPHGFADLWRAWSFDPLVVVCLAVSAAAYLAGSFNLRRAAAGGGRRARGRAFAFAAGWLALAAALVSPLHPWGEVLFSAHMTQHEILMLVAAPLLVLGRPFAVALWALPRRLRVRSHGFFRAAPVAALWRALTNPFAAWLVHAAALWMWHVPALFQATLRSDLVHTLQHASFFLSALLFWHAILAGPRGRLGYGAGVLYLFTTSVHSGLLGVILTLASRLWYPIYAPTTAAWGLTPLEDQQLGGLIMWVPAGLVYIFAGLLMFAGWLGEAERRAVLNERRMLSAEAAPPV